MKTLLVAFFTFVLLSCTAVREESAGMDLVDVNKLTIRETSTGKSIPLSASPQVLQNVFGAPISSVQEYSEVDDAMVTKWTYRGLTMYNESGSLDHFHFHTPSYGLVYNGQVIKVGQHISTLGAIFPGSYAAIDDEFLRVGLQVNGLVTDSFVAFGSDQNGQITFILVGGE